VKNFSKKNFSMKPKKPTTSGVQSPCPKSARNITTAKGAQQSRHVAARTAASFGQMVLFGQNHDERKKGKKRGLCKHNSLTSSTPFAHDHAKHMKKHHKKMQQPCLMVLLDKKDYSQRWQGGDEVGGIKRRTTHNPPVNHFDIATLSTV
jgi:hypothetical protein